MSRAPASWEIIWTRAARSDLRRLDQQVAQRVILAVERYADTGYGDIRRLVAAGGEARLRVGDWRLRLVERTEERPAAEGGAETMLVRVVEVKRVLPRGRAYRD